jgi:protein-S-isoprenylcysteine O-methyltransferase Ste14
MSVALESVPLRRLADRGEQVIAVALYVWLCARLVPHTFPPEHFYPLMLLLSEGMVVLFLLIRRGTDRISLNPRDWIVASAATVGPLLVVDPGTVFLPRVGFVVLMIGFVLHVGAKLALRRSMGMVPADRGVKTLGLYAFIRHPMYLGYIVTHLGFLLAAPSPSNASVYAVTWALLVTRIFLEERFLSLNPDYRAYRAEVRYRLIPGVF